MQTETSIQYVVQWSANHFKGWCDLDCFATEDEARKGIQRWNLESEECEFRIIKRLIADTEVR